MIRVLISDDHPVVRRGIEQVLRAEPDFEVAGQASSGAETLDAVAREKPQVLLLDLSMPDVRGLDLLHEVRSRFPDLQVLVLSIHPEEQYALACLRFGAAGYLNKAGAPADLVDAVRTVATGRRYFSAAMAEKLVRGVPPAPSAAPHETLSAREHQVLLGLASGRGVSELARDLGLSVKTVSTYRARLLEKMGMQSNAELTRYVYDRKLLG